jgi:hypothetical protein
VRGIRVRGGCRRGGRRGGRRLARRAGQAEPIAEARRLWGGRDVEFGGEGLLRALVLRERRPRAPDGGDVAVAVGVGQAEGDDKEFHRFRPWCLACTTFEVADAARAEPGPLGQFLLREADREPEAPEERAEIRPLRGCLCHYLAVRRLRIATQ